MLIGLQKRGWSAYFIIGLMMLASSRPLVRAGTEVYLDITSDQTWTEAGSPYKVTVDITIKNGATVTIQPGVEVILNQNINLSVVSNACLVANGTVEKPIRFGGTSRDLPSGTLNITTTNTCRFLYCHFANMRTISIGYVAPFGNHLIQHCVLRAFTTYAIQLSSSPARVLNNIFRDNGTYGVYAVYNTGLNDENTPQIWYNTFDKNGLYFQTAYGSGVDTQERPFFKYNRVIGGTGVFLYGWGNWLANTRITDCDLARCSVSIEVSTYLQGVHVHNCDLSSIAGNYANQPSNNFTNNYWGTTDINTIYSKITGVPAASQQATPWSTASFFPQADIDNSDNGNSTAQNDADMVKKSLVGLVTLTPTQRQIADVDNNGTVDIRDAMIVESFVNGMIWKLPAK